MGCLEVSPYESIEECRKNIDCLIRSKEYGSTLCCSPNGVYFTVVSSGKGVGIFIMVDSDDFKDSFNRISIGTETFLINKEPVRGVMIYSDNKSEHEISIMESLAEDILRFSKAGSFFDLVSWFDSWKEAIGNVQREHKVYDVLGEMLVLSILLSDGEKPYWAGPSAGNHDLTCDRFECEVKSTLRRQMVPQVEISGGKQLEVTPGKDLYLYVCLFEEDEKGDLSIDVLRSRLLEQGFSKNILDSSLDRLGMGSSNNSKKRFKLMEPIRRYKVDDDFPRLTKESFVGGKLPFGISDFSYSIVLDGIFYEEINLDI